MKRFSKWLMGLGTALAVLALGAGAAAAATSNQVVAGTTDHTVYKVGQTVTVTGTVNGDIFCAGQTVDIDATVNGDVVCGGQTVTVNGRVNGNVSLQVQKLQLNTGAQIGGNLDYTSKQKLVKSADATVAGTTTYHLTKAHHHGWGGSWVGHLYMPVALIVLSLGLVALFPRLFISFNNLAAPRFWLALLVGFLAMFAVPALFVLLAITVVGLPLAFMLAAAWLLAVFLSAPLAAFYTGRLVLPGQRLAPVVVLVGGAVLGLLCLVPWLGYLTTTVALWFGTGNLLLNLKARYHKPAYAIK